jgi:hypothetical protein
MRLDNGSKNNTENVRGALNRIDRMVDRLNLHFREY